MTQFFEAESGTGIKYMRFFSIVTAIVVTLALYLIVFERDRLLGFANGGDTPHCHRNSS